MAADGPNHMRLISITINGYKRFGTSSVLQVNGPLVAIVGPNEAGKTSLLSAIEHLSTTKHFIRTEYAGRRVPDRNPAIVIADFLVEAADRTALEGLLDEGATFTLRALKGPRNDVPNWVLRPELFRDRTLRDAYVEELRAADADERLVHRLAVGDGSDDELVTSGLHDLAAELADSLAQADEDLTSSQKQELEVFATALRGDEPEGSTEVALKLAESADELLAHENTENPHVTAQRLLVERTPEFLFFDGGQRSLETNYEWGDHPEPTVALANLCHLAAVDYAAYREVALDRERRDELQTMERQANIKLEQEFAVWTQAELSVVFRADSQGLQLQVLNRKTLLDVPLEQRSSGLRSFVALIAFTARYGRGVPPVLLIDEAETHLHYGAQADLMQVFERQRLAQTIIYTTHSIGCLPEDLGTTIRVVAQTEDERSEIRNAFWSADAVGAGLSPLMLAMGAELLAFTPARFALIGEGPTEAILLPSLFREARDARRDNTPLGFQTAPGVARVSAAAAADLELDAGNVAYLVDSDDGGRAHGDKLANRVKDEGRFLILGEGKEEGLCTEDFVELELYVDAVNAALELSATATKLTIADLPNAARPRGVDAWCRTQGLDSPAKTLVAVEALRLARESGRPLVEPTRRAQLADLYEHLRRLLNIP